MGDEITSDFCGIFGLNGSKMCDPTIDSWNLQKHDYIYNIYYVVYIYTTKSYCICIYNDSVPKWSPEFQSTPTLEAGDQNETKNSSLLNENRSSVQVSNETNPVV